MRLSTLCAAASVAATTLVAFTPAKADPYHLIRWRDTGFCQAWDQGIPTTPFPGNYDVIIRSEMPNLVAVLNFKEAMLRNGTCRF